MGDLQVAVARGLNSSHRTGVEGNQTTTKSAWLQGSELRSLRKYLGSKLTGTHIE